MAHAFDTGLASAQRTLIRNGAVTLLSGLKRPAGYLQAVVPWGGIIRGYTDELGVDLLWEALGGRTPAIAIGLGDAVLSPAGIGGWNFTAELELTAFHHSSHPRDMESGRLSIDVAGVASNTADPGLDVMMEHARELLVGQRCGASATIKQIVPTREEELRTDHGLTLWAQRFSITLAVKINPHRGLVQILDEIRTNIRNTGVALLAIAAAPAGATQVGSLATFTTTTNHGLVAGNVVTIAGVAVAGYNGTWTITLVPSPTTFKAVLASSGLAASGGGTATGPAIVDLQNLLPP